MIECFKFGMISIVEDPQRSSETHGAQKGNSKQPNYTPEI